MDDEEKTVEDKTMDVESKKKFRAKAARLNYLGMDRSDIQFGTKEICRDMANPTAEGERRIKRMARYLVGARRMVWRYGAVGDEIGIDVWVDSDWAGGKERRSTSGGMVAVGGVGVKHWSRTQRVRALSSGEAEYYGCVKGASMGLGARSMGLDLGIEVDIRLHTDSSAARGISLRKGLGKVRHISVAYLWLQERIANNDLQFFKCKGTENPADLLTKHVNSDVLVKCMAHINLGVETGRAESAKDYQPVV